MPPLETVRTFAKAMEAWSGGVAGITSGLAANTDTAARGVAASLAQLSKAFDNAGTKQTMADGNASDHQKLGTACCGLHAALASEADVSAQDSVMATFPAEPLAHAIGALATTAATSLTALDALDTAAAHHVAAAAGARPWLDASTKEELLTRAKKARNEKKAQRRSVRQLSTDVDNMREDSDSDDDDGCGTFGGDNTLKPQPGALEKAQLELQGAKVKLRAATKESDIAHLAVAHAMCHYLPELEHTHAKLASNLLGRVCYGMLPVYESTDLYERIGGRIMGGAHEVFIAVSPSTGSKCVLKKFLLSDARSLRTFKKEAGILARLQHPNVVQVHASFQFGVPVLLSPIG